MIRIKNHFQKRWYFYVIIGLAAALAITLVWALTRSPAETSAPTLETTPVVKKTEPTTTPDWTKMGTPLGTPTEAPKSLADAVVANENGAELRPGATTWWFARETLATDTELDLLGYDPEFSEWVYVGTKDGASTGWTQVENLEVNVDLEKIPLVTPMPTPQPTIPASGPLTFDFWHLPGQQTCLSNGWNAKIFAEGHGGNGTYTYYWQGEKVGGPTSGSITFDVYADGGGAVNGTGYVTSGDEQVSIGLHVPCPCED